jgi:hypothetical protein
MTNGRTSSRFMAKRAFLTLLIAAGCGGGNGPTASNCTDISGTHTENASNSCGGTFHGTGTVTQTGCSFAGSIGGTVVQGTIDGNNFTFTGTTAAPCSGPITGSGTITTTAANGTFTGTSPGGAGCCPAGPVSGSFTIIR